MTATSRKRAWRWLERQQSRLGDWAYPTWPLSVVILVLLSLAAIWPLLQGNLILTGDTSHPARIYEMHRCLSDGQIPCRWAPDFGNGYGYPLFNYYPPLPYYAGAALHWFGFSYVVSANLLAAAGLIAAGLSMFALARHFWGELGGIVSAVAYMFAPYLALDIYMRGAIAELWALAVLPVVFLLIYLVIERTAHQLAPLLALAVAALLLSHNLVVVIAAPAIALWIIAWLIQDRATAMRRAVPLVAAGIWGIGLAAFFTLPVLFEGDLVQLDSLSRFPFHYSGNFASIGDLLFLRSADYSALLGERDDTPIQIGWFQWSLAFIAAAVGIAGPELKLARAAIAVFFATMMFGLLMSLSLSKPVWDLFDQLRFIQFPWRFVGLISFAASLIVGSLLLVVREYGFRAQAFVAATLVVLFVASGWTFFRPYYTCDLQDADLLDPSSRIVANPVCDEVREVWAAAVTDYLPKEVLETPQATFAPVTTVSGNAHLLTWQKGSDWLTLDVSSATTSTMRASVFAYPDWQVLVDGDHVPHIASKPHGLIEFELPAGRHQIDLRLHDTGLRTTANAISLVSWVGLLLVVPFLVVTRRQHQSRS